MTKLTPVIAIWKVPGMKHMRFGMVACALAAVLLMLSVCVAETEAAFTFADDLQREITVDSPQRVAVASGSLAECWLLAGGELYAATEDTWERDVDLPEETINIGSLKNPSLEMLVALRPDLVLLSSALTGHLSMSETLDRAGITHAFFDTESFSDYAALMDVLTSITGRKDLYKANAGALAVVIENAKKRCSMDGEKVLLLRSSTVKIKALNSETMVGSMLREFGCVNIADSNAGLLTDLSLEAIVLENPDYIFITCMGDPGEAMAQINARFASNPLWNKLQAVQNARCFYLEKELFHYKPNARWGESYEKLAELLSENQKN